MSRMLTTAFPEAARISVQSWSPPVDVQETDDAFVIEADLPGVRPDDVSVEVERNELRITGEYGAEQGGEGEQQQQQQRTRRSGRFDYRVTLPGEVDTESATANLESGVLRLQLRKAATARQRIPVQSGTEQSGTALPDQSESQG